MMKDRLGTHLLKKVGGESYKVYVPAFLPPDPPIEMDKLFDCSG